VDSGGVGDHGTSKVSGRPTISVVIPAYNAERFIVDALRSVVEQRRPPEEVLVVDDGSTDGTRQAAESVSAQVRVIHQRNAGVSAARNTGWRSSRSTHVAFLDADDRWHPEKLGAQVEALTDNAGPDLVYTGYQIVDENLDPRTFVPAYPPIDALRRALLLQPGGIWISSTALVARSLLERLDGFDEALSTSADCDFALRAGALGRLVGVERPLADYRQHSAQMHHNTIAMARDMERIHNKLYTDSSFPNPTDVGQGAARAALALTMSLAARARGEYGACCKAALIAVIHSPAYTGRRLACLFKRRRAASVVELTSGMGS
jgi:glycosyltransferase involved in cell wall biosynthesis